MKVANEGEVRPTGEAHPFPVEVEILNHDQAAASLGSNETLPTEPYKIIEVGPRNAWRFPTALSAWPAMTKPICARTSAPAHRHFGACSIHTPQS